MSPTFFLVGAPKAGTTSLFRYLGTHPEVGVASIKEPCFFAPEIPVDQATDAHRRDWPTYLALFAHTQGKRAIGEGSVAYLGSLRAASAISARIPSAQILMMLRDPADRLFAHYAAARTSGATTATFRVCARAELGMAGAPSLLWVGRLNENKDPLTVLRGLTEWRRHHAHATLTMAFQGHGELHEAVRRLVASTPELTRHVTLVGEVPHDRLAAYYSAADIFVLGSHHEGSGYAAIEALACGAIPVVTDIAPFRALTGDGAVGALWEAGNADAFAVALTRVMQRPLEPQRQTARDLFAREFSWHMIGRRAAAVYREVIASRALARASAPAHKPA